MTQFEQRKLRALVRKWEETIYSYGNDLGKVKTIERQECAKELKAAIEELDQ